MDSTKKYNNPNPEGSANIISKIFFWWTLPFFKYGYKNDVQAKDLYNAVNKDVSEKLGDILEREWYAEVERAKRQKGKSKPSLMVAIRKAFIKPYSIYGIVLLFQSIVIKMLQPFALLAFIKYFHPNRPQSVEYGWLLAVGVVALATINVLIMHFANFEMQRIGMRCRIACCSLIYRKLLRLNRVAIGETAAGQLVNLLSNDVVRFDNSSLYLHYIWLMPVQAVIGTLVMYEIVGVAAFAGIVALVVQAIPLQGYLSKKQGDLRYKIAKQTDFRVKLMSEITSSMQVIKMYAWEKPFEKMVHIARKKEINVITITSYIKGVSTALMVFTERVTLFLTIVAFVLLGNELTGEVIFSVAQLFNTLQLYMAIFYPMAMTNLAESKISVKRIQDFLIKEEKPIDDADKTIAVQEKLGTVKLEKIKASWLPNPIVDTLSNLNLHIKPGTLCVVVGQVGSGKSSLLQLLLKELPINSGSMEVVGKLSFASQEPWLFVSTAKDNILFGEEFDKARYRNVVKVCALEKDFEQLPNGDRTLITEKGISLSGGQRARINLARAVYREADIYLMDDPLSAVDTHVGKHLFEQCIMKYLKGKTRILTTHQLQFLKQADLVVIMNNGQIQKVGTFNELSESELKQLQQEEEQPEEAKTPEGEQRQRLMSVASHNSTVADEDEQEEPTETEELIEKGSISKSVYSEYIRAGGNFLVFILTLMLLIAQAVTNASDIWLTHWTNTEMVYTSRHFNYTNRSEAEYNTEIKLETDSLTLENASEILNLTTTEFPLRFEEYKRHEEEQLFYINIYTALIIGSVFLNTARSILFFKISMRASKGLHDTMFNNILQATMRFFDTNPSGRILNRFSKDIGAVDEILPKALLETLQIFLVGAGILVMAFIVTPWLLIPTAVVTIMFYYTRKIYLASAQDVKRLEGTTKAPLFSHLSASLHGISTIRCYNTQPLIAKEFDVLQDQHTGAWFLFLASSEAFGLWMDLISVLYLAIVTFQFLIFDDGSTLGGNVGLVISQCLILTGMTQYGVRQSAEVASQMTSVERVLQYTKLDKEGPFESLPANRPDRDWPKQGNIQFEKVYLYYVPTEPPVLKNLNIFIKAGEKIGIVGRTGAGKSSLMSALFRLAPIEGKILIDGIDTATIGLHDLRKQISIIPQEPVLFSATVRYNLDPFGKCDDKVLWEALEKVELKEVVPSLDHPVAESGSNFSAGQRQLVCLARAIIRDNNILVMDEATANVDPQTDFLIQSTIRNNFKDCTVLTIAHRLNTIMDSDRVLVMSAGEAVEFDVPHKLLQNPNGHFTSMVRETGRHMEDKLREVALEAFMEKEETNSIHDSVHELSRIE